MPYAGCARVSEPKMTLFVHLFSLWLMEDYARAHTSYNVGCTQGTLAVS